MDITGKIIFASEPRTGTSKTTGNPWMTQDFGKERLEQMNLQVNGEYTVSFDIDAHEFNGRWFNDIRAWRAVPVQAGVNTAMNQAPQYAAAAPAQTPQNMPNDPIGQAQDNVDDLPF